MGYRSQVAYAIAFRTNDELQQFVASRPPQDMAELWADGTRIAHPYGTPTIVFEGDSMKWYASRILGGAASPGYRDVDRHEALLAASREWTAAPLVGVFIRVGEETGDVEHDTWGEDRDDPGLPHPWELAVTVQTLEVYWEVPEHLDDPASAAALASGRGDDPAPGPRR